MTGEFESRLKTTALAFGPQPWTYASASPAMKVEEVPYTVDTDRRERGFDAPEPDFTDPVATVKHVSCVGKRGFGCIGVQLGASRTPSSSTRSAARPASA